MDKCCRRYSELEINIPEQIPIRTCHILITKHLQRNIINMCHQRTYLLISLLLLNFVSPSFLQQNPMNFYQPKYGVGQANDYMNMNMKLRNVDNPVPSNEKPSQQQNPPPPQPVQSLPTNDINDSKPNQDQKSSELQRMVQQLYMAQAQVQLEATEIQRAQTIASAAQKRLEEASNNVRIITTALRSAQEAVASTAQRAQTAQLQLAAHDQLLFTARQKVDALSAQLVGLQAEVGIAGAIPESVNLSALLEKLKEPLHPNDQPKPPVSLITPGTSTQVGNEYHTQKFKTDASNWNDYKQYVLDQQRNHDTNNMPHKLKRSYCNESKDNGDLISPEDAKTLLDWIHEENRKDLLLP